MAALVQTYPQQISAVNMLQARPSSATGMMPGQNQGHQYMGSPQGPRASSYGTPTGYRGSSGPVQPRSFANNQPNLNHNAQWQQHSAFRANSSPAIPSMSQYDPNTPYRGYQLNSASANTGYNYNFNVASNATRDDSAMSPRSHQQPAYYNTSSNAKNTPDRYRRANTQSVQHNRSQSTGVPSSFNQQNGLYQLHNGSMSVPNLSGSLYGSAQASKDDMSLHHRGSQEDAMRLRRRSMHSMDNMEKSNPGSQPIGTSNTASYKSERSSSPRLVSGSNIHTRSGSSESASSTRSSHSRPSSVSLLPLTNALVQSLHSSA